MFSHLSKYFVVVALASLPSVGVGLLLSTVW